MKVSELLSKIKGVAYIYIVPYEDCHIDDWVHIKQEAIQYYDCEVKYMTIDNFIPLYECRTMPRVLIYLK